MKTVRKFDVRRRAATDETLASLESHRHQVDPLAWILGSVVGDCVGAEYSFEKRDEVLVDVRAAPRAARRAVELLHRAVGENFVDGDVGRAAAQIGEHVAFARLNCLADSLLVATDVL